MTRLKYWLDQSPNSSGRLLAMEIQPPRVERQPSPDIALQPQLSCSALNQAMIDYDAPPDLTLRILPCRPTSAPCMALSLQHARSRQASLLLPIPARSSRCVASCSCPTMRTVDDGMETFGRWPSRMRRPDGVRRASWRAGSTGVPVGWRRN
jgi:hypothetical protein